MADKPVTREEKYLAYLTGDYNGEIPKPITRKEKYLYELCLKGMGGEISPEEIKNAVNEYLEKNPVKPGATTEQAQQIEQNKTDIGSLKTETGSLKEDLADKLDTAIYENDFDLSTGIEVTNPEIISGYIVGSNGSGNAVSGQSHGRYPVEIGSYYRIIGNSNASNNVLMGQYRSGAWSQYISETVIKRTTENIDTVVKAVGNFFFISFGTYTKNDIHLIKLQKKQILKDIDNLKNDVNVIDMKFENINDDIENYSNQLAILKNGAFEIVEETGKELTLRNALVSDYPSIKANLLFSQSGSGTPSVNNIRTITGVLEFSIVHNGTQMTIPFESPVYGGYIDVNDQKIHVTHASKVIDGVNLKVIDSGNILVVTFGGMKSGNAMDGVSEWIPTVRSSSEKGIRFGANNTDSYIYNMSDVLGNAESANKYFKAHPLKVVYPLENEIIIELSNDRIITKGNDTLSSDVDLVVKYYRKADAVNKYQGISETGKALIIGSDGNVTTGEAGVSVDNTLTQSGKAADAKIVGDRINSASTLISEQVNNYFSEHPAMGDATMQFVNSNQSIVLGDELLSDLSGEGWSGNLSDGYTHASGYTDPLTQEISNLDTNAVYKLEITTSNARLDGYSDFYVSLGGSQTFETYKGGGNSVSYIFGIVAGNNSSILEIIPSSSYVGIITGLSLKKIESIKLTETSMYTNTNGNTICETRFDNGKIAIGINAGSIDYFGASNTTIGDEALAKNTDGFWNTAIGYNALHANIHGTRNVAIGFIALQGCITGDRNIAIGTFAMEGLTTGRGNIAIGADAYQKRNGSYNIGIGVGANGGSSETVHIGHRAGNGANGKNNVSVGSFANESASGTDFGVAIGYQSGQKVNGKYNTFVGAMSGKSATTGQNNILIGYNCNLESAADSNQTIIGNSDTKKTKVYGDFVVQGTDGVKRKIVFNSDGTCSWVAN